MIRYNIGVEANTIAKAKEEDDPVVISRIVSILVNPTVRAIAQHLAKDAKNVGKITTSKSCVNQMMEEEIIEIIEIKANPDKRKGKERNFMK